MNERLHDLKSENLVSRFRGILACYDNRNAGKEDIKALKNLLNDDRPLAGRKISSYAAAALHLLGHSPEYIDEDAKKLIEDLTVDDLIVDDFTPITRELKNPQEDL